jgi:hypothetical protein
MRGAEISAESLMCSDRCRIYDVYPPFFVETQAFFAQQDDKRRQRRRDARLNVAKGGRARLFPPLVGVAPRHRWRRNPIIAEVCATPHPNLPTANAEAFVGTRGEGEGRRCSICGRTLLDSLESATRFFAFACGLSAVPPPHRWPLPVSRGGEIAGRL